MNKIDIYLVECIFLQFHSLLMAIWHFKQAYPFERASLFSFPQSKAKYGQYLKLNKEEFVFDFSNFCQSDFHGAEIFHV